MTEETVEDVPFIGELRLLPYDRSPREFMPCQGQLLSRAQNPVLFALIGFTFGGDGGDRFALPDLRGRVPVHPGNGVGWGEQFGVTQVKLATDQLPWHNHRVGASSDPGRETAPQGAVLASSSSMYAVAAPDTTLHRSTIGSAGGGVPHENRQPSLGLCWMIAHMGLLPPRP